MRHLSSACMKFEAKMDKQKKNKIGKNRTTPLRQPLEKKHSIRTDGKERVSVGCAPDEGVEDADGTWLNLIPLAGVSDSVSSGSAVIDGLVVLGIASRVAGPLERKKGKYVAI